jgi:hypothetical protein
MTLLPGQEPETLGRDFCLPQQPLSRGSELNADVSVRSADDHPRALLGLDVKTPDPDGGDRNGPAADQA